MKVTWEEKDIICGRTLGKEGLNEQWLIGYRVTPPGDYKRYVTISLSDGLVSDPSTKEHLAGMLTDHGYLPKELMP